MISSVVLMGASIATMCASGLAVSVAYKFLHNFELDFSKKSKPSSSSSPHRERLDNVSKRIRPNDY